MASLYRVRTTLQYGAGSPGLSTNYFLVTGGTANATDAATVAGRVRGGWDVAKAMLSLGTTATVQPNIDVIADTNGDLVGSFGITPPAVVTGTGAAQTGPTQVMVGVRWLTSTFINGRRGQGRTFMGPIGSQATDFPTPQAAEVALVNAYVVGVLTASVPAAVAPAAVWSRPTSPGGGGSSTPITAGQCAPQFYTLRSRRD